MRWQGDRQSENIEDRRGMGGPMMVSGGLGTLVLVLLVWLLGGDPLALLQQMNQGPPPPGQAGPLVPGGPPEGPGIDDKQREFVAVVLADTEDVWHDQFRRLGRQYRDPKLVLFSEATQSACGFAQSATGPFFCPEDDKVYLDTSFFRELEQRFHSPGDFAKAYVIAHEVGHHVQHMLGWSDQVHSLQQRSSKRDANKFSVRLELQADYLAGVWAYHANRSKQILEAGDVEAALNAATAIGDDRLQREARGYVVPDSFTHGFSAQRVRWFRRGLETGDFAAAKRLFDLDESEL
ncbi:MAG: neutral zinc metallopeptidase [Planctomycetia bacterium]|nr:neutral zinc metallopeptidase [Planctomycetia bacterium]